MGDTQIRMPGVVDRHVHLGLVDGARLRASAVVEVHDLGWEPDEALRFRREGVGGAVVRIAGPFLTPPGGYPKGRSWAPDAAVREIGDVSAARAAVAAAAELRFDVVKVALHAGFPPFEEPVLRALVEAAHAAGLPVVAHVEGPGRAALALGSGVDVLAHVPWTERLDDAAITRFAARTTWISTLAVHAGEDRRVAVENARRFVAAGGRLRYGTDLGNGPGPVGVRRDEVLALGGCGLRGATLIEALTGCVDGVVPPEHPVVTGEGPVPQDAEGIADWYLAARRDDAGVLDD